MSLNSMEIIKTIRTHSEPINTLLICKNGNLVSGSLGRIIFYSKKNLEVILRITEFKEYYISHINELHKDNNFLICHNGFKILETTSDNKKYKVLFSFYERFMMNKSIEFEHKYISESNKEETKYSIIISTVYGMHIFEKSNNKIIKEENKDNNKIKDEKKVNNSININNINDENKKGKIESLDNDNNETNYTFVKKINYNEIVYNILQINNNCFISTSNSVLASGNNCLRFWSYTEMTNIKTLNNLFCSSGIYSIVKIKEKILLVGLEKIPKYLIRNKKIAENLNINGIAVIDLEYNEIVQFIETHNCIRSLLLAKNDTIIAGSTFKLVQYKFNRGFIEKIGEKELFNYINNSIVEVDENIFATGSNNKLILVIK